ncbi:MAG: inner membrane CreD family protein, partial [Bacteroidota bacterium]
MTKRIIAVAFIFACCCMAWGILGGTVVDRTQTQDREMQQAVGRLWGGEQVQAAPTVARLESVREFVTRPSSDSSAAPEQVSVTRTERHPVALTRTRIDADLELEHRRKGLLWYPTYDVAFDGTYGVANETEDDATYAFRFLLPSQAAVFGDVKMTVDGTPVEARVDGGALTHEVELASGESAVIAVAYTSQGTSTWRYELSPRGTPRTPEAAYDASGQVMESTGVATIRDFALAMTTDFADVDFPPGTLSPTEKRKTGSGWRLAWDKGTLVTDAAIGMAMPQKLNPGPWVSRVTFFAP